MFPSEVFRKHPPPELDDFCPTSRQLTPDDHRKLRSMWRDLRRLSDPKGLRARVRAHGAFRKYREFFEAFETAVAEFAAATAALTELVNIK